MITYIYIFIYMCLSIVYLFIFLLSGKHIDFRTVGGPHCTVVLDFHRLSPERGALPLSAGDGGGGSST